MSDSIVVQQPAGPARQLVLLFHGVRGSPNDMRRLGERVAMHMPQAWVGCACGPQTCEPDRGYRWFDSEGIHDGNRAERVAQAGIGFCQIVREWQQYTGIGAADTTLIGFSQGAAMCLEAIRDASDPVASRVVAIAGRCINLPEARLPVALHFVHGLDDEVVSFTDARQSAEDLRALGLDATMDAVPGAGHTITREVIDTVLERMLGVLPSD